MTLINLEKTPWPYFGGKAHAAEHVWAALGDVDHYIEPFAGSLAVLLRRPHECNRTYHSETVNDLDGLLVNAWRAMQLHPDEMADAASWPVSEADLHARHLALVKWRADNNLGLLMADPAWCDPVMAGWWAWGVSCWIGSGFCSGKGAWVVGADGRITKNARAAGRGMIDRKHPHPGNNGGGVNHAGTREPGVAVQLPHLGSNGQGVNRPQAREPGCGDEPDFHPMTMPELRRWFRFLSARLRHVRILNGDWRRAVTDGASKTITVRMGKGAAGIFLDPPYADTAKRTADLYTDDCTQVAHAVREWAIEHGDDPDFRIVLAGFAGEHVMPETWREVEWYAPGFLRGGMGNQNADGNQQKRERLWMSPHCLCAEKKLERQMGLFTEVTA